ncbi:MAG: low molecular weight protein arginine phosphatase [Syntrophomonadaceae bacterium]|nr:low molecular weight protein arginine phosphatase [Syntrophomonadaceae bacterium]
MHGHKVLFVCSGNTCRSPMAVALFRKLLKENYSGYEDKWEVDSAGLFTIPDLSASPEAVQVMQDEGIDLTGHRSKSLQEETVREAGLIIAMTVAHKQHLVDMYPWASDKIFTLKELAGEDTSPDIRDPFGRGIEAYRESCREIKHNLQLVLKKILDEAQAP